MKASDSASLSFRTSRTVVLDSFLSHIGRSDTDLGDLPRGVLGRGTRPATGVTLSSLVGSMAWQHGETIAALSAVRYGSRY
jgi:hypothetical protein